MQIVAVEGDGEFSPTLCRDVERPVKGTPEEIVLVAVFKTFLYVREVREEKPGLP